MSSPLNLHLLRDFLDGESDDIDQIMLWYERLSEYEPDGSESAADTETLIDGLRYLMNFSFTAADELKTVAEKEAAIMAEREDEWEEQRRELRAEADELREQITGKVDPDQSADAFRATIDSLKEEIRQLQSLSRDRDRELADQRDRFENLLSRSEALMKERDTLLYANAQKDDTIREQSRRLTSREEPAGGDDWSAKKLKQRNAQAAKLAQQMQLVVAENEHLRSEVERVSSALEEATRLVEDTAARYADLSANLEHTQTVLGREREERERLAEQLSDKTLIYDSLSTKHTEEGSALESLLQRRTAEGERLRGEGASLRAECDELRARIASDLNPERERELERLRLELVQATKMAHALFGQRDDVSDTADPTEQLRMRMIQLEAQLIEAREKISEEQEESSQLRSQLENRDAAEAEVRAELLRMQQMKFGDAAGEIARLAGQVRFREEHIAKLRTRCSLLHVELGRLSAEKGKEREGGRRQKTVEFHEEEEEEMEEEQGDTAPVEHEKERKEENEKDERNVEERKTRREKEKEERRDRRKEQYSVDQVDYQAVLIANLYNEIMQLMQELDKKDALLRSSMRTAEHGKKALEQTTVSLRHLYSESLSSSAAAQSAEESTEVDELKMEAAELRSVVDAMWRSSPEQARRVAESARRLVAERVQLITVTRQKTVLERRAENAEQQCWTLRVRAMQSRTQAAATIATLHFQMDSCSLELARLQSRLLHSVPLSTHEQLADKYRRLLRESTVGGASESLPADTIGVIDLLPQRDEAVSIEELNNKNGYLKKIVDILTEQTSFWSLEAEHLQKENDELKRFIEEIENESDMKGLLGSIERRLLSTIREQSDASRERESECARRKEAERDLAEREQQWREERRHLAHILHVLQASHQKTRLSVLSLSLDQMETFKRRLAEAIVKERQLEEDGHKVSQLKSTLEVQIQQMQSQQAATQLATDHGSDRLTAALSASYLQVAQMTANADGVQAKMRALSATNQSLLSEVDELKRLNEEYLSATLAFRLWRKEKEKEKETRGRRSSVKKDDKIVISADKIDGGRVGMERAEEQSSEYGSESAESSESGSSDETRSRVVVRTVVRDNTEYMKKQLEQMRNTAKLCIDSYKEQLEQKDRQIESYKDLLLQKIDQSAKAAKQPTPPPLQHYSPILEEEEEEEEKKEKEESVRSERRRSESSDAELATAKIEIDRLNRVVEELEETNRELFDRKVSSTAGKSKKSCSSQTEPVSPRVSSRARTVEREAEQVLDMLTERSHVDANNQISRMRNEIYALKNRVKKLTETNKALMSTCEKIRGDALEELAAVRALPPPANPTTQHTKHVARLQTEVRSLKATITSQQSTITSLTSSQKEEKRDREAEMARWEERKRLQHTIAHLNKGHIFLYRILTYIILQSVADAREREEEWRSRADRLERRAEEMRMAAVNRQSDIERINRRKEELQGQVDTLRRSGQETAVLRERAVQAETHLDSARKDLAVSHSKMYRLEKERESLSFRLAQAEARSAARISGESPSSALTQHATTSVVKELRKELSNISDRTVIIRSEKKSAREATTDKETMERLEKMTKEMKEVRRQLRLTELRLIEANERLSECEKQKELLEKDNKQLLTRIRERERGAVAVLGDKLESKNSEILNLKAQIKTLERRLSQGQL